MWTNKQAKQLFEDNLKITTDDIRSSTYSTAQFPRTGEDALIELQTRAETLQWVLEMWPDS